MTTQSKCNDHHRWYARRQTHAPQKRHRQFEAEDGNVDLVPALAIEQGVQIIRQRPDCSSASQACRHVSSEPTRMSDRAWAGRGSDAMRCATYSDS